MQQRWMEPTSDHVADAVAISKTLPTSSNVLNLHLLLLSSALLIAHKAMHHD